MVYKEFGWTYKDVAECPSEEFAMMCVIIRERMHLENEETQHAQRSAGSGTTYGDVGSGPLFTPDEYALTDDEARASAYEVR